MGQAMGRDMITEMRTAKWFSIVAGEATDISYNRANIFVHLLDG